jgi:hypothetical protein
MESSKKTRDFFGTFQYVRSGINVNNARLIFCGRRRIYIIRSRIKTDMKWERRPGEYPPAPPDTLRIFSKLIVMQFDCYCFYCCCCCWCWILYYLNKDCCCSSASTYLSIRCGGRSILEKNWRSVDVESTPADPRLLLLLVFSRTISLYSAADVYQEVEKTLSENLTFSKYWRPSAAVCLLFSFYLLWVTSSEELSCIPLRRFAYFCFGHIVGRNHMFP